MTRQPIVVKLGGSVLSALPGCWWDDVAALARSRRLILVHGWSRQLRDWQERRNVTPVFLTSQHGHRSRLTDVGVIADIRSVAAGLRARAAEQLAARGVSSRAVDAAETGLLTAEVIPQRWWADGELRAMDNLVGPVSGVDTGLLRRLLGEAAVLIVTPLAASAAHPVVNVDGDRAAAAIAVKAAAAGLILVTDVAGVLAGGEPVPVLRAADIAGLRAQISGGMRKKVAAAVSAASGGVGQVVIGNAAVTGLMAGRAGTRVTA